MWATSDSSLLIDVVTSPEGWYMEGMSIEVLETDEIGRIGVFSDEFWMTVGFSSGVCRMVGSSFER